MKTLYKKICVVGIILAAAIIFQLSITLAVTDKTISVVSTAVKPVTPGPLLDDFRYAAPVNLWSVSTNTFSSSSLVPPPANAICTASYINDSNAYSGYSLKLNYDVSASGSSAGYYSQLAAQPLIGYTAISFYVKGAIGGEFFKIQLKNNSNTLYSSGGTSYHLNTAAIYITDYLDGGVTITWQKVTIPFHNFANLDGFSSMKELVFVFENAQNTTNGSLTQGTVYIDDIKFETTTVTAVRIDHFGDKIGTCALGGNIGTGIGNGAPPSSNRYSFSNVANEYSPSANGLKLEYNVNVATSYAYTYLIFGGGNDAVPATESGWIALPHDFSVYNYLYFQIRGSADGNPKEMRIELTDSSGFAKVVRISGIATGFQYYNIPLNIFADPDTGSANLNTAAIKQLTFVFEGDRIGDAGGNKTGIVYIDSVQFEQ